jgi:hypothetical protein
MENISEHCYEVFKESILQYHIFDSVDTPLANPYQEGTPDNMFFKKNWIDTIQWHLEDLIRHPAIECSYALSVKRRIDDLNQRRTDIVELIDDHFQHIYRDTIPREGAMPNTESLGWALDRLSILAIKEFHVDVELYRTDATTEHLKRCSMRRAVLDSQKNDLLLSINWLAEDIRQGRRINKVYKQLKMYNDPSLNPVLYTKK